MSESWGTLKGAHGAGLDSNFLHPVLSLYSLHHSDSLVDTTVILDRVKAADVNLTANEYDPDPENPEARLKRYNQLRQAVPESGVYVYMLCCVAFPFISLTLVKIHIYYT